MRKLNYNIPIGTEFLMKQMSWQFPHHALCLWRVCERVEDDYDEVEFICEKVNDETSKLTISEMCLAYLLGEEVPAETNVPYNGTEYQPSNRDPWAHYAQEDGDDDECPFWYFSEYGYRATIHCVMNTEKWCYYTLPWD